MFAPTCTCMNGPEMGSVFDVSKWGKLRTSCRHQEAQREGGREGGVRSIELYVVYL